MKGVMERVRGMVRQDPPTPSEADNLVMDCYRDMQTPLASGAQLDLLRWRCKRAGLESDAQQFEVWERVRLVDAVIADYNAKLRAVHA